MCFVVDCIKPQRNALKLSSHKLLTIESFGCFRLLDIILIVSSPEFFGFTWMSPERFQHLLGLVGPLITKKRCCSREVITPQERLMVTLWYLAEGEAQQSQAFNFRMGKTTVSNIVRETCEAIWTALNQTYLKTPKSSEEWKKIADGFEEERNFPHCLGSIDGKRIMTECPKNAGSAYYNYKISTQ